MARSMLFSCLLLQLIFAISFLNPANAQLKVGYYSKTCPQAEAIVKTVMDQVMSVAPSLAAPLLRLHFHDCFVRGCDGSVLLNSSYRQAEKNAIPNLSLRGFQVIDRVKTALEKECPGVVSCADILAIVARDVTVATEGPFWEVETGRREWTISNITEALLNLPPPSSNISSLISRFEANGLSIKDLVVLSGAHTIGTSHCTSFSKRIYNFAGKGLNKGDPVLDSEYIPRLMSKCKPGDQTTLVEMDPGSFRTFDLGYYRHVAKRRGLFQSDSALLDNNQTRGYIKLHALANYGSSFFQDFGVSMVNMGRIGVITGSAGEIRKVCSKVN